MHGRQTKFCKTATQHDVHSRPQHHPTLQMIVLILVQDVGEPVAAALLTRMNAMSKMHVASVVVALLFGNQSQQTELISVKKHQKNSDVFQAPSERNEESLTAQNLSRLAAAVQRMLPVLQQMGLVDHTTLPCSLAHVLLNREVTREQENVAVSLLPVLNRNHEIASSISATIGHAPKDGLEHLQQSTITVLEEICSGLASGAVRTRDWVLHTCIRINVHLPTEQALFLQARRGCSLVRELLVRYSSGLRRCPVSKKSMTSSMTEL